MFLQKFAIRTQTLKKSQFSNCLSSKTSQFQEITFSSIVTLSGTIYIVQKYYKLFGKLETVWKFLSFIDPLKNVQDLKKKPPEVDSFSRIW